jgi:hypothetical protein
MNARTKERIFDTSAIQNALVSSLFSSRRDDEPYPHWLLQHCLPPEVAAALYVLPFQVAEIEDTQGRRETHNDSRVHFGASNRAQHPVMDKLAHVFQDQVTVDALKLLTHAPLAGTSLRIEYCQDTGDFWLEPHTDIGVKKFTMLIYLNPEVEAKAWGTDIYRDQYTYFGRVPCGFNCGLIFVPGINTWHGFKARPIIGVRKTIIINYVGAEWINRNELCFPDQPVA